MTGNTQRATPHRSTHGRLTRRCKLLLTGLLVVTVTLPTHAEPPRLNPVVRHSLGDIQVTLPSAELHFYSHGDIPDRGERKYLPPGRATAVELETNLGREKRIQRLLWQVSRTPFYGPVNSPVGLVASGYTSQRVFEIPLDRLQAMPARQQPTKRAAPDLQIKQSDPPKQPLRRVKVQPEMQPRTVAQAPRLAPSVARTTRIPIHGRWSPPVPHYYVRVIPVDNRPSLDPGRQPAIVGRPSATLELILDEKPLPDTDMSGFNVVSRETFDLRLVSFRYQPTVRIERWPPGCKDIPRDEGKDAIDVIGDVPEAAVDLVNWASEAYADMKKIAVSVVGSLLPFVPESVISVALDAALAAAGMPPSIPNVDQLMSGGADYLATQVAAQIPVPGSGVLAEMAADEAREEIRRCTRDALLDTARRMAESQRQSIEWCTRYVADPFFEVTLRNAGSEDVEDASFYLGNSSDLLETTTLHIAHMDAGQTFTLPIAYRQNKNIPYRWVSQMPNEDRRQARIDWWTRYQQTPVAFTVAVTQSRECRGDGNCDESVRTLLETPTRLWDNEPAWRVNGR